MVEAKEIFKNFGGAAVLEGASLRIEDGETVGLFGDSGAGKSTFARILCGLEKADAGRADIDGKTLFAPKTKYDGKEGVKIQMIYQQPFSVLDPSQKISDGIKELAVHLGRADRRGAENILADICAAVDLDRDVLDRKPHKISGGEAQRIAIGKSLMFSPRLLILDEATAMLDATTQANVLGMVKREMRRIGGSVLLISHDTALVNCYCDKIFGLNKGVITQI